MGVLRGFQSGPAVGALSTAWGTDEIRSTGYECAESAPAPRGAAHRRTGIAPHELSRTGIRDFGALARCRFDAWHTRCDFINSSRGHRIKA